MGNNEIKLATFGAGCFWGVEAIFKKIEGVIKTTVGYSGGIIKSPTYESICTGETGHAEAIQIEFDPDIISYKELLGYFWRLHNPTTLNRQGPDVGTQYRSVIFYHNKEQKKIAEQSKDNFDISGVFKDKVVTEISEASVFYKAEEYHQDYHSRNGGYMCHVLRDR